MKKAGSREGGVYAQTCEDEEIRMCRAEGRGSTCRMLCVACKLMDDRKEVL